jgi:tetratricopeptide (TPR) repeat protein
MHSKVPGWLRAVLVRGLAVRPEERFPSMHELLAALADDPAARRRRWYLGMGAGSVVIATSVAGYLVQSGRDQLCEGGQARLTGVWDDARRSSVEQAFLTSDKPYAEASWTAVARTLDDYAERWTSMHREACQATRVHGAQSDALLEVRMECLGRRLAELRALTDLFIDADAALVQAGVGATGKLVPLAICADVALLTAPIPIPDDPQVRVRVEGVREQLALVKAHEDAGRYPRGAMLAADAVERARQAGYAPVLAESLVRRGRIAFAAGDFSTAESALREAAQQAALGHHDEMAAQAWTSLVGTVGHGQARFERAEELVDMANAAVERAGDSAQFRADLAMAVGALRYNQGRFDAAQRRFEAALTHQMEAVGSDHPSLGRVYNNIAAAAGQQGDDEAFERHLQAALVLNERHFGDQHPLTAMTIANIGAVELQAGSLQEAKASFERALRIWEQAGVGDHPDFGVTVHNRGVVAMLLGDLAAAESHFRRAVRVQERALGEHPNVARSLGSLSWVLLKDDRVEPARETLDRAFEIARATIGEDHPEYGQLLAHQGLLRVKTHQNDAALEVLERALTMTESSAQLRRLRPQIQFSMAQASFDRDPARARELALTAIEGYVAQPALDPTQRSQLSVRRWMAEHEFEPSR